VHWFDDVRISVHVASGTPSVSAMPEQQILAALGSVDSRLTRVEQFLPALATREELERSIAPLATREELERAIAPLATREEMHATIAAAVAPLATREDVREEGEWSRRYTDVLIEDLRDDNRLILEHLVALSARVDALANR
jgi:hypothetical protein